LVRKAVPEWPDRAVDSWAPAAQADAADDVVLVSALLVVAADVGVVNRPAVSPQARRPPQNLLLVIWAILASEFPLSIWLAVRPSGRTFTFPNSVFSAGKIWVPGEHLVSGNELGGFA
jgi:hypothetical protein